MIAMSYDLRLDEFLRSQNPGNTPSREAEPLGQSVDDEHVVLVYILDVLGGRDSGAVAVAGVVVAGVELVAD